MRFTQTDLADAWLIDLDAIHDQRGMFARAMAEDEFASRGMAHAFVQMNLSQSVAKGTLRGLHYQRDPYSEAKLVRCTRGAIWDVIVDLRSASPTYLRSQGFELTAQNRRQLYVPPGFAHGFLTLEDDVEVFYPVSAPYTAQSEGGLRYDDPGLAISWPIPVTTVSEKDRAWPLLDPSNPVFGTGPAAFARREA